MNARWQGYVEQREKYTHALEQRCSDLEQAANQHHHQQHPHPHPQHQQQQLTEEQQRRVDQILLDQRQKTELAVEARLQVTYTLTFLKCTHNWSFRFLSASLYVSKRGAY